MYYALKKIGKNVRILNVDGTAEKYNYLQTDSIIQCHDGPITPIEETDLALIFDTNDYRLLEPLYADLKKHCKVILFVDHHPALKEGPAPTEGSWINTAAASTGEMAFDIISQLGVDMNRDIARAIYTSVAFDTQLFRFIRNSPRSHEIAAQLLHYDINIDEIHRHLFSNQSKNKMAFVSEVLAKVEYSCDDKIAALEISHQDLEKHHLKPEESRDIVDIIMNIKSVEGAVVFRQEDGLQYRISLRSKGLFPVHAIAEKRNGGGHRFASGASVEGTYSQLRDEIIGEMTKLLNQHIKSA